MERRRLADKVAIGAMPFNTSLDGWATSRRRSIRFQAAIGDEQKRQPENTKPFGAIPNGSYLMDAF
ncbi:hypothetical protein [Kingella oralis]|uniref:hypothetical protein n=1 Tax=Kingella oralis TaxID=505 RepID=UPI0034E52E0C